MKMRALIVDDNRALAEDLGEILSMEGYDVSIFDDPVEALRQGRLLTFQLAVLDVRMPVLDGVALSMQLRETHAEALFVLMTAYSEDERIQKAKASGVGCVLPKPVPLAELLRIANELQQSAP